MLNDGVFLGLLGIVVLLFAWMLHKLINCPTNRLEWTDLVATNGYLNAYKIAFLICLGVGTWVIIKQTYMGTLETGTLGLYFAFGAGAPVSMAAISAKANAAQSKPRADKPLSRGDVDPVIE